MHNHIGVPYLGLVRKFNNRILGCIGKHRNTQARVSLIMVLRRCMRLGNQYLPLDSGICVHRFWGLRFWFI